MMDIPSVFIVILHWNAGTRTISCLKQLERWHYPIEKLEIIVVDNASTDGSSFQLSNFITEMRSSRINVRYICLKNHPGVTRAFNLALEEMVLDCKYVMRLDNDVELATDALGKMVLYLEKHDDIGVIGPKVVYASNPEVLNAGAIWVNKWGNKNRMEDPEIPVECDTLLGAIMLVRNKSLQVVGEWFDSSLYLFAEEIEFCWRLRKKRYLTYYFPYALALHDTAQSTGKHSALSDYLNYRNHTLVLNKTTPLVLSIVRALNLMPRIIIRCIIARTWIPLIGFIDGTMHRPLSDEWWQTSIKSNSFSRPKTK